MRLIIAGCEYSGTTTLAEGIGKWAEATLGSNSGSHDHFKGPPEKNLTAEEEAQFAALKPRLLEMFQRYQIEYHLQPGFYTYPDHVMVGMHLEDAVYAPLYYGYGGRGQDGDRTVISRMLEQRILQFRPDAVLILVEAAPDVIRKRMAASPHPYPVVPEADVEHILQRFEEEFANSLIRRKFKLDTSTATVAESVADFAASIQPYLSESELLRLALRQGKAG